MTPDRPGVPRLRRPHHGRAKTAPLFAVLVALSSLPAVAALPGPTGFSFAEGAKFTVAKYEGNEPLTNFPVLVCISNNAPAGFSYADVRNASAADRSAIDLAFVDMEGEGLPFEIDTWDPTGASLVWVRLPTMTNGTEFVMCWGGGTSGKSVCGESPFSGYVGVWHMSEANGTVADSSGHGRDAVPAGTNAESLSIAGDGPVGNGRQCANQTYLSIENAAALDVGDAFSVSGWFNMSSSQSGDARFFSRKIRNQQTNNGWEVLKKGDNIAVRGATGDNIADYAPSPKFPGAGWKHLFVVYDGNSAAIYENGVEKRNASAGAAATDNDNSLSIGSYSGGASSFFVGSVDECRLLGEVPSGDWAKAEYDTVADAAFLTAGEAEPYGELVDLAAGVSVTSVAYTNATASVSVQALGAGAASADVLVQLAATDDFAAPLWSTNYAVQAAGARTIPLAGLATNATYFVRAFVTNNLNAATAVGPVPFTTSAPGAPTGSVALYGRDTSSISATATVSSSGSGASSASVRLEVSADGFATTASSAWADVPANASLVLTASGLAPLTAYGVRLRLRNDWGLETVADLGRVVTLPSSGLTELYVDSLGNGSGTSPESALPTIREALDLAGPGFTIWVRGGEGRAYAISNDVGAMTIPAALAGLSIRGWDGSPEISVVEDYAVNAGPAPVVSNEAAHVTIAGLRFAFTKDSLGTKGSKTCHLIRNHGPFLTLSGCEFRLDGDLPDDRDSKSLSAALVDCSAFDATNMLVEGCSFVDLRFASRDRDCVLFRIRDNTRFVGNVFSNVTTVLGGIQLEGNRCTGPFSFVSNIVHQAGGGDHRGVFSAGYAGPSGHVEVTYNRFVNDDGPPRGSIFRKGREGFANGPVFHHNTIVGFREFIFAESIQYNASLLAASILDNIFVLATDATNIVENATWKINGDGNPKPTMFKAGSFYRNNALLTGAFNGGTATTLQIEGWTYDLLAGLGIDDTFVLGGTTVPAGAAIPAPMPDFADADTFSPNFYRPKASRRDGTFNYGKVGWTGENREYPEYLGALPPLYPAATMLILK